MNFEFSGMTVLGIFLALIAVIVALIFIVKSGLQSKDSEQLNEEFEAQPKVSPLVGRNKYPQLDVFKSSGTYFGVGVVSALFITLLAFNWTQFEDEVFVPEYSLDVEEDIMVEPPRTTKPPPPPPPPPPPVIEEVPEELVEEENEPVFEDQTVEIEEKVNTPPPPKPKKAAPPPPPPPPPPKKKVQEIFKAVEEMPRFPGCENEAPGKGKLDKCSEKALLKFIYKYIEYPTIARETGLEGRAIIQFVVDTDGSISGAKVLRDIGGGCGDEAVRVINLMNKKGKKWKAGRQQGQSVRVQYILPVKFQLE